MRRLALISILAALPASAAPFEKSGIADWTKAPPPAKEPAFKPPVAKRMKLANGMALLVVENHKLPIVAMALFVPGAGASADPASKFGLASFTADLLDEGTGDMSALAIAEEEDRLGASIGTGAGVDSAQITIESLSKTLDQTIDLATKVITQPAFDAKELERVKGDRVTALDLRRDRPREVASLVLYGALYGAGSAYGHPASGVREDFKTFTGEDVKAFYQAHYTPAAMTLVVSGDVDPAALKKKLEGGLGAWKPAGAKPASKVVATPAKVTSRLLLTDRPGAAQSDVRIGLVGPARKDPRYFQFEVLRTTLGDGFTSRLTQRLREQLGITYGASAFQDWRLQPGPFVIASAIVTPATGQGVTEAMKILDDLSTNDLKPEELEKSKQNMIRALPSSFETNMSTALELGSLALHGLPDDWYARYADNVRKVTAKDVKTVAKALIPSGRMVVSVVGDLSKVRADLDKLGLGEATLHDPYGVPLKK